MKRKPNYETILHYKTFRNRRNENIVAVAENVCVDRYQSIRPLSQEEVHRDLWKPKMHELNPVTFRSGKLIA